MQTAIMLLLLFLLAVLPVFLLLVDAMTRIVASKLKAEPHRNGIEVRMLERKPAPEAAVGVASSS